MSKAIKNEKGKLWLKKETRPYKGGILFLTFLSVFTTLFSILFAYMVRYLINSASEKDKKMLWIFAGVLLLLLLFKIVLKTARSFFAEKLNAKMTAQLRTRLYGKILRSDYSSVQHYHTGDLLTRLNVDINEVASYSVNLLPALVGMIVQCLGAIVALLTIDPLFTAIYIVAGGGFAALTALFRKHLKKSHKEVLKADGEFRAYTQESLSSLLTLKAYNAENKSLAKAENFAEDYYQKRMSRNALRACMNALFALLSNFGLIFAVVWCSVSVLYGNTDYGAILSAILLLMQLQSPLASFSSIPPAYYARIANGERLADIEDIPVENTETFEEVDCLYSDMGSINFENVTFTYGREEVLKDINVEIKKGEIVCLTGASGSGKSTIFKLLLNIFQPTHGRILLNNINHQQELTAKDRGLFAYVPQGNFLFSGTIYENLTFFAKDDEETVVTERIHDALKVACAEFVFELPQGLDTVLTEHGGGLSEGQLQRLALARALLSNRPILLLDEATSALDGETECQLLTNLSALEDKTCLIVTHRPKALEIADKILRIENGTLI